MAHQRKNLCAHFCRNETRPLAMATYSESVIFHNVLIAPLPCAGSAFGFKLHVVCHVGQAIVIHVSTPHNNAHPHRDASPTMDLIILPSIFTWSPSNTKRPFKRASSSRWEPSNLFKPPLPPLRKLLACGLRQQLQRESCRSSPDGSWSSLGSRVSDWRSDIDFPQCLGRESVAHPVDRGAA